MTWPASNGERLSVWIHLQGQKYGIIHFKLNNANITPGESGFGKHIKTPSK